MPAEILREQTERVMATFTVDHPVSKVIKILTPPQLNVFKKLCHEKYSPMLVQDDTSRPLHDRQYGVCYNGLFHLFLIRLLFSVLLLSLFWLFSLI